MKKYKLVKEKEEGTVFRIIALRDFSDVRKGEKGGFVQNENNLSHDGNCWVYENAVIFGNAQVYDNAVILGTAQVSGEALVFDNAVISGNARVGNSWNAWVYGEAWVEDDTQVSASVEVYGEAVLADNAWATKKVITFGNAFCYKITVSDHHIRIDCKQHLKSEWKNFTDKEILKMEGKKALKFWRLFKPLAEQMNLFD